MQFVRTSLSISLLAIASVALAAEPPARIAWYGQLADGLAEAQRTWTRLGECHSRDRPTIDSR